MRAPKRRGSRAVQALVVGMLICAAGCAARSTGVPRDDVAITEAVRARLAADAATKPYAITVGTTEGVVHVEGAVAKSADRDSVERIVRETPGVRSVDNDVRFGGVPAAVEPSSP